MKLSIWHGAALIFESHQNVEIDIFTIYNYSLSREAVDKTTSEDSLIRVLLESQKALFPTQPLTDTWKDSFSKCFERCSY